LASPAPAAEWVEIIPDGPKPPPRAYTTAAYDSQRHRMLIFGGDGLGGYLNDVWAFDIASNTWEELTPVSGPMPVERETAANVYDPAGDRMLMWSGQSASAFHNDTWAFDLVNNAWSEYAPPPPLPNERYGVASIFDPVDGDLVTFAGFTNQGRFDDTQRFNPVAGAWTDVSPAASPPERCLHSASYDSQNHRLIMYGGQMSGPLGDIWAFDLDAHTWEELTPTSSPPGRWFPTQVYDIENHRALVFGGHRGGSGGKTNEVWAFDLAGTGWQLLEPSGTAPSERDGSSSIYVPGEDRMLVFGGRDNAFRDDLWSLEGLSESSSVAGESGLGHNSLALRSHPNPTRGATTLSFKLGLEGYTILQIFDVQGRRVRTLLNGRSGGGSASVDWDGRTDEGRLVPEGVYVVSLRGAEGRASTRITIIP
ncbi:MAG: T9SS type A sorting domain-containing protein, partial [Candidatus Eisenbacteria bacterium]|nr:T9SS type A sorting domain-containing protein [Candidatus Eisenbacteria bacterium]